MTIRETRYKDRPALALDTGAFVAVVLPEDGGKLASVKSGARELLCEDPGLKYRPLAPDGVYVEAECAGFDDMFPTIDPCLGYPDHGEVCRHPHAARVSGGTLELTFASPALGYRWKKTLSSEDGALTVRCEATAERDMDALWAGHMMLAGASDMRLETPFPEGAPVEIMFSSDEAAHVPGQIERFGDSPDHAGLRPFSKDGLAYKYYFTEPSPRGEYAAVYPAWGKRLSLRFDPKEIPYAGVWSNAGSFQGKYNLALELCTAPFDRPDRARGARVRIRAGETLSWGFELRVDDVKGA